MEPLALLRVLQLADSGFPTGAFSFSHGLEGLTVAGVLDSRRAVTEVVRLQLREGFAGVECPVMAHAWRAAVCRDVEALTALDELAGALKPTPVFRKSSEQTGRRLLAAVIGLRPDICPGRSPDAQGEDSTSRLAALQHAVRSGRMSGHHAVIYGAVMAEAGVDEVTAALALGAGFANSLTAAAVRLGVIGATAAQQVLAELQPELAHLAAEGRARPLDDLGGYLPIVDVMGLRQRSLAGRVFAS